MDGLNDSHMTHGGTNMNAMFVAPFVMCQSLRSSMMLA